MSKLNKGTFSNLDSFRQGLFTAGDVMAAVREQLAGEGIDQAALASIESEILAGVSPEDAPDELVRRVLADIGLEVEVVGVTAGVVQYRVNPLSVELAEIVSRGYRSLLEGKPRPPVTTNDVERVATLCMKLNKSKDEMTQNLFCMGETEKEKRDILGLWEPMIRGEDGAVELDPTLTIGDVEEGENAP